MDEDYKHWIVHRNLKELDRRTRYKLIKKQKATKEIAKHEEARLSRNIGTNNSCVFNAPLQFSLVSNAEEAVEFFNNVIKYIIDKNHREKRIYFDISKINALTIDALMYLLALVNNVKNKFKNNYVCAGNFPDNAAVKLLFTRSGFLNYLRCSSMEKIIRSDTCIEIRSGNKVDRKTAKDICDFVINQAGFAKRRTNFLYCMIMELMENTKYHAYTPKSPLVHCWYIFVERKANTIQFSFLDTGVGIPHTVYKQFYEKLNVVRSDSDYILSALKGDFRTETRQRNRGNGLPKIYEYEQSGKIQKLKVLSGRGLYGINHTNKELLNKFQGTLFYWEISFQPREGDCICQ